MRVALAVNPTSGLGRGLRAGHEAAARLRAGGAEVEELAGKDADDLRGQVQHALGHGVDALVVVGGDGMVHLGVNAVVGTSTPLGIVAAGTGNDVARALDLPVSRPAEAALVVLNALAGHEAQVRAVDAVRCAPAARPQDVRWFAGVLGAGFDAIVNERANGWNRPRGRSRYILATLRELPVFTPRTYVLDLDGERWTTRAMLVAVANGPSYGGGMRVAPDADLGDGLLDVMVVEPISRAKLLRLFPRVYSGTHVRDPHVIIRRCRRITLDAPGIVGYADGERLAALPLTCEVVPAAVRILSDPRINR
jgi:diacylglycerol kinase (ATP)